MTDLIPLVIDFESYHDSDYTLKKMPTLQYIRDPRFECLGCAIKLGGQDAVWISDAGALHDTLDALPWDRIMLVAHNAQFDAAVLVDRFGHRPARYACTMFMLRYLIAQGHLDPEQTTSLDAAAPLVGMAKGDLDTALEAGTLDAYATRDADICGALFEAYWHRLPEVERDYIHIHVLAAADPVFDIDRDRLQELADADRAMEALFPVVRKDDKFAAALDALGVNPEWKTTAKGTYKLATSKKDTFMQRLHDHPDPRVRKLAEVRAKASSTIERTRSQRFLDVGAPLPAPLLYYGAHTGRSSGLDKLNVQNLKRDGDTRRCIKAPKGHSLIIADSAQIEPRILAWLAGEERLLRAFRQGRDVYADFSARHLCDWSSDRITEGKAAGDPEATMFRNWGKVPVLQCGFACGGKGLQAQALSQGIDMPLAKAEAAVRGYRLDYPLITGGRRLGGYWKKTQDDLRDHGYTDLPNGEKITYPSLRIGDGGLEFQRHAIFRKAKSEGFTNLWHGKIIENKVQRVARDVVFEQSLRLWRAGWRIVLMVHDETVLCVPDDQVDEAKAACEAAFSWVPEWIPGLPVAGEVKVSKEYMK